MTAATTPEPYATSAQHLEAELARLDLILRLRADPLDPALPNRLDEVGAEIGGRMAATMSTAVDLRIVSLAELFDLIPFDVDVVVFCLAPEIDERYERIFARLQGDAARRAPTAGLVLDALCRDLQSRLAGRRRLSGSGPLLRHRLVTGTGTGLRLDPRITAFLLEDDALDDRLTSVCTLAPAGKLTDLVVPAGLGTRLAAVAGPSGERSVVHLWGGRGVGKRTTAAALCAAWGAPLLVVDGVRAAAGPFAELVDLVDREARLRGAVPYWAGVDALEPRHRDVLLDTVAARVGPTLLGSDGRWRPAWCRPGMNLVSLELPAPGRQERLRLWSAALADPSLVGAAGAPGLDVAGPAGRRLSGGQIRTAVMTARNLAAARTPGAPVIEPADLDEAARQVSRPILDGPARLISPRHGWDDLVLPADRLEHLREIVTRVVHRRTVHETWSFGPASGGRGLNVLFAGPPGTGKTMAAEVLADALGRDLYKIDLAEVAGEDAAGLGRIVDDAAAHAVLFLDGARALFGRRIPARDAHALLQRLEEHDGVVVLATCRRSDLDAACARRVHATVEFPVPDIAHRLRIWERVWPTTVPRAADLDLRLLAREVDLPGGNIRNIAEAGAFLAAADGGVITMEHLVRATRREYQKMGSVGEAVELDGLLPA